jgi:DNA-binding winged helix-turn-helix (wHTH) protein/formylglycine-generating enzyme required for sulfatase activity/predicted esterase
MDCRWIADGTSVMAVEPRVAVDLAREAEFSLGELRIRPSSREVLTPDRTEVLEPRVMQVLVALARRRGEVVSRDDLIKECWAGRVVGEDAITRSIARVRRLAEAHASFSIETIARVGYRLTENNTGAKPATASALQGDGTPVASNAQVSLPMPAASRTRLSSSVRRVLRVGAVVALVAALALAGMQWRKASAERELHARVLSQIADLVQKDQYGRAFNLAMPLLREEPGLKDNPAFAANWRQIVLPMRPLVAEAGATVYFKPYDDAEGDWLRAGVTPLTRTVDAPRGPLQIRVTKPGFRPGLFVVANPGPSVENESPNRTMVNRRFSPVHLPLAAEGVLPDHMVLVPRTHVPVVLGGWTPDRAGSYAREVPPFAIARHETTNAEFKQFVDAGGYDNPAYWQGLTFEEDGHRLSWPEARKRFVDTTNRPGPAGWQLSTYPSGRAEFPVGGISWYEAVAYARFRGEELPTIHHWLRAAFAPYDEHFGVAPAVAVSSRFYADGPDSALRPIGLGAWGTWQMSGNVREWVWNFAGRNALALGGAWSDYASENHGTYTASPMSRLPSHGVRLMRRLPGSEIPRDWLEPIHLSYARTTALREPASDEAFEIIHSQFTRTRAKPAEVTVANVQQTPLWIAERVVLRFTAEDSATVYIVRPKIHAGHLQPIVYAPPQNCCTIKRDNDNILEQLRVAEFVVNSGRALVLPVWSGSYERWQPEPLEPDALRDRQREYALAWNRDLGITIDYLESRADIAASRAGFLGFSNGAVYNVGMLAVEPRIKAAVLLSGGISVRADNIHPMLDLVNYGPRIKVPVLMINGRFDHILPYERSQRRLFQLLGTPAAQKSHIVYEGGHFAYPPNSVARDTSNWFDRYLGAAR